MTAAPMADSHPLLAKRNLDAGTPGDERAPAVLFGDER
jgi:hypothetical protein